ncbi:MAG: hypothetical protein EOO43_16640 [Flavobacterium sp.]|nr:MAG: hypothetical protein EOO43_16640 [Flavobacterium sp.]
MVVAWVNGNLTSIQAKGFDVSGTTTPATISSQVTASGTSYIYFKPSVAINDNNFAIAWSQSRRNFGTYDYDIYGRVGYISNSLFPSFYFSGSDARIHADDTASLGYAIDQTLPSIAANSSSGSTGSGFIGVWNKSNYSTDSINGFNSSGTPTTLGYNSIQGKIATPYNSNNYTAVWKDNATNDIYAKRYTGSSIYASSTINTTTTGVQEFPAVATDGSHIVVVWQGPDGSGNGVYAQIYDISSGTFGTPKFSSDILVNTTTTGDQSNPSVAMDQNGNFVVTWLGFNSTSSYDIYAQRFDVNGNKL